MDAFSLLVSTVDGTDSDGVVCLQVQSRAAVVLTGGHLLTGAGGGVRGHSHIVSFHTVLSVEGGRPLERDLIIEKAGEHWLDR